MKECIVIGLTGQTGSGKSTVCNAFMENGYEIINCDLVARAVTTDGSECCKVLSEHFPDCFDKSLHLDRKALGEIVFNDRKKLDLLNRLIFPFINKEIGRRIERAREDNKQFVMLDAPTLFEAGADKLCDIIVSCVAKRELRRERIMIRDGIDGEQADSRIASQHDEEFFRQHSDLIIENNGGLASLARAAEFAAKEIKTKGRDYGTEGKIKKDLKKQKT